MTQAFRYPSSTGAYLPLTSPYIIAYIRDEKTWKMNRYWQLVEAPAPHFYYAEIEPDVMIRIRDPRLLLFSDGADRPKRQDNQVGVRWLEATCLRYSHGTTIGNIALEMGNQQWHTQQVYQKNLASQAMTNRAVVLFQGIGTNGWLGLDNSSTWPSTNVASATSLNNGAGFWTNASTEEADAGFLAIRKSLFAAANVIIQNTNNVMQYKDLRLVVSPDLAYIMANTGEIRDYYKYTRGTVAESIEDSGSPNYNECYGLPSHLYGIEMVVEDAQWLGTADLPLAGQTGYSTNRAWVKNKTNALLLSREGGIDSVIGPSFSTVQLYWFDQQLAYEQFVDPENRVTKMYYTDYFIPVLTGGRAGFDITACCAV